MIVKIYPENPNEKAIGRVCESLRDGDVIIYPTDSVYALGCSLKSVKGVEKLKKITGKSEKELTLVCPDLSTISEYAKVDNVTFKILKKYLPGAITFILNASRSVPVKVLEKRKTIGVRVPDNAIVQSIIKELEGPLLTASVKIGDLEEEYTTDPELIDEMFGSVVDVVIDGGICSSTPTTLVDLTGDEYEVIREGAVEFID